MKKKTILLLAGLIFFTIVNTANAIILTFDDISPGTDIGDMPVYNGFIFGASLDWIDVGGTPDFWYWGAHSGIYAIVNNGEHANGIGEVTRDGGGLFTFDGLWAKKAGTGPESGPVGLPLTPTVGWLEGTLGGVSLWRVDTSLEGSYQFLGAHSEQIDTLIFGMGANFLVDDLSLGTTTSPVPEPGTIVLLGSGLVGMFAFRKKVRKSI